MEEFKLHANGASKHLKSLKESFESFKKQLKNDTTLSTAEKESQFSKAKCAYLEEKKTLKTKLF